MRKMVTISCAHCQVNFSRRAAEVDRCNKSGRPHFCGQNCYQRRMRNKRVSEFFSKASRTDSGCLEWQKGRSSDGYGRLRLMGKLTSAHRAAWELSFGQIPVGLHVCHKCDNPPCIDTSHLFLGTRQDNMRDMTRKGRGGRAKLKPDEADDIRRSSGPTSTLANRYGVPQRIGGRGMSENAQAFLLLCSLGYIMACFVVGGMWLLITALRREE